MSSDHAKTKIIKKFSDASILEQIFVRTVTNYLDNELMKYAEEPLNQLIALFVSRARFPRDRLSPSISTNPCPLSAFLSLLWTRFELCDERIRAIDETSLNLRFLLSEGHHICDTLSQLIQDTGYTVNPDVYVTACINALSCIPDFVG